MELEFHMELVSTRGKFRAKAISLISFKTVFFCKIVLKIKLLSKIPLQNSDKGDLDWSAKSVDKRIFRLNQDLLRQVLQ
jgi:hypothetical protein